MRDNDDSDYEKKLRDDPESCGHRSIKGSGLSEQHVHDLFSVAGSSITWIWKTPVPRAEQNYSGKRKFFRLSTLSIDRRRTLARGNNSPTPTWRTSAK